MKNEKNQTNSYLEDIEEWQENQYNPGYYLGGKIPGNLLYSGRTKLIGIFLIIIGLMTLFPFLLFLIGIVQQDGSLSLPDNLLQYAQMAGFGILSFILIINGIRKIISIKK